MSLTKQALSTQELLVLNFELDRQEKSLALAYLMLLGGHLGVHRFYLKRKGTAVVQLLLFLAAGFCYFLFFLVQGFQPEEELTLLGLIPLFLTIIFGLALGIWILVDLFLIPRMVRDWNDRTEQELIHQLLTYRRPPQTPSE